MRWNISVFDKHVLEFWYVQYFGLCYIKSFWLLRALFARWIKGFWQNVSTRINLTVIQQRKTRVTFIKFELLVIIERQVAFIVKSRLRFVSASKNVFAIYNILHFNAISRIFTALQPVEQHCIQSEIGIDPVVGMPISRHSGIVQN